jgi:transcription elongation factor GreA
VEYELVGAIEPQVGDGRVSVAAPVGRALVGQRVGARLNVATPGGTVPLEVLGVRPADVQQLTREAA